MPTTTNMSNPKSGINQRSVFISRSSILAIILLALAGSNSLAAQTQPVATCSVAATAGNPTTATTNICSGGGGTFNTPVGAFYFIDVYFTNTATIVGLPVTHAGDVPTLLSSGTFGGDHHYAYIVFNSAGDAANTVTVTGNNGGFGIFMVVSVYTDIHSGALDVTAPAGSGGPSGSPATGLFTTTHAHDRIIGACAFGGGNTPSAGSGYTFQGNDSQNRVWLEDRSVNAIQTNVALSMGSGYQYSCLAGAFQSLDPPVVTTTPASNIQYNSATSGGVVTNNGGSAITSEGVCYATTANPTTPCTSNGTATPFTSPISGLSQFTIYHYRAFATNAQGTSYGADMTFQTPYPASLGADIHLTSQGSTETQIIVNYTATSAAPCFFYVTDNNDGPSVNDFDPSKFTNANQDLSRTIGNGFRWPTLISGLNRTLFIGGHNETKQGIDGKNYVTALQVVSDHTIQGVCNAGADIRTIHVSTNNIPIASNYAELPIPTPGSPMGGYPVPTIDWSRAGRNIKYLDATTGEWKKRITGGDDNFAGSGAPPPNNAGALGFTGVFALDTGWTNIANLTTIQASGTLASSSTVGARLFAAITPGSSYTDRATLTDHLIVPYGNSTGGTETAEFYISSDSGQTAANYTAAAGDAVFSTSAGCQPTGNCSTSAVPSLVASSRWAQWGGLRTAFGQIDMYNRSFGGVSMASHLVTMDVPAKFGFNVNRVHGSKFYLVGSGCPGLLTVDHVDNTGQITAVETGTCTSGTFTDASVGIGVKLKTPGTINVSMKVANYQAQSPGYQTSGAYSPCSTAKVTDIAIGVDGTNYNPPMSGFLCLFINGAGIYLIQDDGKVGFQSAQYTNLPTTQHLTGGSFTSGRCITSQGYGTTHLFSMCHIANDYSEPPVDMGHSNGDPKFTYTDLGVIDPVAIACAAYPAGPICAAASTGLWVTPGLQFITDDGKGGAVLVYNSWFGEGLGYDIFINAATLAFEGGWIAGDYPNGYMDLHGSPQSAAGNVLLGVAGQRGTGPRAFDATQPMQGPFTAGVLGVRNGLGTYAAQTLSITGCTRASPAICTAPNSDIDTVNGISANAGALMNFSGATGTGWSTGLNGPLYAHSVSEAAGTFSLYTDPQGQIPLNSTGFGTLGGTITATLAPVVYSLNITSVASANAGANTRLTMNFGNGAGVYYPSWSTTGLAGIMRDSDPITIVQQWLHDTVQYYAKVSCGGCSNLQFDVYRDAALTIPVAFASQPWAGWYVVYAERCPDPATITLPGPQYLDSGFGSPGAPWVRCVTTLLNSNMQSDYASGSGSTGEHAKYPPTVGDARAGVASVSQFHPIHVGDGMMDLSHVGGNHEILYALKVDATGGPNSIAVTSERSYGDLPNYGGRGSGNGINGDTYAQQHMQGWTATGVGIINGAELISMTTYPATYLVPPINGCHADLTSDPVSHLMSSAVGYACPVPDDVTNVLPSFYAANTTSTHSEVINFGTSAAYSEQSITNSYPSRRGIASLTPASEQVYKTDVQGMQISSGNGGNAYDGYKYRSPVLTPVAGYTNVYLLPTLNATQNIKVTPLVATAFPDIWFTDKSGPGSTLLDTDLGYYVYVLNAGEGVPGSTVGQVYISGHFFNQETSCTSNQNTIGTPCAFGLWPGAGWAVQERVTPTDVNATGTRRLTWEWAPPPNQWYSQNWVLTPDSKWGLFTGTPIQQRNNQGDYGSGDYWMMKVPPWPATDTVNRSPFVNIPVQVSGVVGDSIRIQFGYGENGDPSNYYCTTRAEKCWTNSAATPASPFLFNSETAAKSACASGCTVNIPAIAGRVVFYSVCRTNGGSENCAIAPLTAKAVP